MGAASIGTPRRLAALSVMIAAADLPGFADAWEAVLPAAPLELAGGKAEVAALTAVAASLAVASPRRAVRCNCSPTAFRRALKSSTTVSETPAARSAAISGSLGAEERPSASEVAGPGR